MRSFQPQRSSSQQGRKTEAVTCAQAGSNMPSQKCPRCLPREQRCGEYAPCDAHAAYPIAFAEILKELPGNPLGEETPPQNSLQPTSSEPEIKLDLDLSLDDVSIAEETISAQPLPDLSLFWPHKTAQYWIPSDENQGGKHLCIDLSMTFQDNPEFVPSDRVPVLFYHGSPQQEPSVLVFNGSNKPYIRKCIKSAENELYNKDIPGQRMLLVPTFSLPQGKLLVITPPVANIGVLEKATDVCWAIKHIGFDNERCVFFEEGNTPNTLRQSKALTEIACGGRLYIVMCAWELISDGGIETDINDPHKAAEKMIKKQRASLCPSAWRQILFGDKKRDLLNLKEYLLGNFDETGIYRIKNTAVPIVDNGNVSPFKCDIALIAAELKNFYLEMVPILFQKMQADSFSVDIKQKNIVSALTRIIFEEHERQQMCFPPEPTCDKALRCSIAYLAFLASTGLARNFGQLIDKIVSGLLQEHDYPKRKHHLFTCFPDFYSFCSKEMNKMSDKISEIQKHFWAASNKRQLLQ